MTKLDRIKQLESMAEAMKREAAMLRMEYEKEEKKRRPRNDEMIQLGRLGYKQYLAKRKLKTTI